MTKTTGQRRQRSVICQECSARPVMDRCSICEECWYVRSKVEAMFPRTLATLRDAMRELEDGR